MPSTPDDPQEPPRFAPPPGTPPPPPPHQPPGGAPPPPQQPPGGRRGFGGGVAAGLGIGCGAYVLGIVLALGTLGAVSTIFGFLWPFIAIAVVSIALMFSPRSRPYGTGMLIMTGAAWLIVIGPCIALLGGFG
ncbi:MULTISPECIES: hypothetical protein [Microbacterium]|uniref:DUF4190 domain-containing protein n=1 Tax=Microbacterium wangchenii TaxID=2541726 RepID=A0ABX5SPW5_9MICO|nr:MULTISPECIES: hypothetical protein [Microbacterium]MCK6066879.1 hypothetical protein [Microbacterium sp. EYE_512]QBR88186.1 hypothetical protein E4K62_05440 [Microbacterium wangchenii]TFV83693.1 hypothetical protein E4V99_00945 [Microbacterium sp. dk485]TXK18024.1 hypothetical protein FVP99_05360 [Microbacterium wangchenii]